jgi:CheY-like chemotaxis protein
MDMERPLVLMVEDNPVDVDLVQLAFAREVSPPTLIVYTTAEEVLALSRSELDVVDCFAIDPGLPGMSGQALSAELRAQGLGPTLLLAMSRQHAEILVEEEVCDGAATKSLSPLRLQSFLAAYHAGEKRIVV